MKLVESMKLMELMKRLFGVLEKPGKREKWRRKEWREAWIRRWEWGAF